MINIYINYLKKSSSIDVVTVPPSEISNNDAENTARHKRFVDVENTLSPKHKLSTSLLPLKSVNILNSDSVYITDDESESGFSNSSFFSGNNNRNSSIFIPNNSYTNGEDNNLLTVDTGNNSFVSSNSNFSSNNVLNSNFSISDVSHLNYFFFFNF